MENIIKINKYQIKWFSNQKNRKEEMWLMVRVFALHCHENMIIDVAVKKSINAFQAPKPKLKMSK